MTKTVEHEWELALPAKTAEELLVALATRDRLFGQSITMEPENDPELAVEVWLGTNDVLDGDSFNLQIYFLNTRFNQILSFRRSGKTLVQELLVG